MGDETKITGKEDMIRRFTSREFLASNSAWIVVVAVGVFYPAVDFKVLVLAVCGATAYQLIEAWKKRGLAKAGHPDKNGAAETGDHENKPA